MCVCVCVYIYYLFIYTSRMDINVMWWWDVFKAS